jgi:predicted methyltransferase
MKNLTILIVFFLASCSQFKNSSSPQPLPGSLEESVNSSLRATENSDRDEYQHPLETLKFFGIKPEMTVIEISPGAGYFAEILAPYLAKNGQYIIAVPRMPSRPPLFMVENERKLQDILLRHHEVQAKSKIIAFEPLNKRNVVQKASADLVLSFNSVHNWVASKSVKESFKFFHALLKPGGILGVVQHRIPEGKKNIPKSGYLTEKEVIQFAKRAGFKLVEKSEINANPKDTQDYPGGVWTLPPTYRLGEKDKDRYEDIGESDRMTLKFVK